jgi:hypothetical protein
VDGGGTQKKVGNVPVRLGGSQVGPGGSPVHLGDAPVHQGYAPIFSDCGHVQSGGAFVDIGSSPGRPFVELLAVIARAGDAAGM